MATKNSKGSFGGGKVKFRVIEFELEGSDESLHDGLKNLAAALLRANGAAPPTRQLRNEARSTQEDDGGGDQADDTVEIDEVEEADVPRTPSRRAPSARKPVTVKTLDDIVFDDVTPTLPDFFASKKPSSVMDKYLVIAYWYKNTRKISDLTTDHFHTALRFLNEATPKDAAQPVRDLRHRKRGKFSGGKTPGTCTINHVGENAVRDMGKGA